jgi:PAS domain S-box-containing protein
VDDPVDTCCNDPQRQDPARPVSDRVAHALAKPPAAAAGSPDADCSATDLPVRNKRFSASRLRPPYEWPLAWQYVLALGLVAASLAARWLLHDAFAERLAFALLFSTLLPLALLVRPGPFLAAAAVGFTGVWWVFIPPAMSFSVAEEMEGLLLGVFGAAVGTTALTAWLSRRARLQRESSQQALLESARRLQLVSDAAPALISYVDSQLRFRVYNRAYAPWFGREHQQLYGLHMRDLLGEDAFQRVRPYAISALAGHHADFETEVPHADGSTRFVQSQYVPDMGADGSVRGFYALVTDISDRKRMEDELRLRSEQFETLLNEAPLGVYLLDADLRIQQVNPIARSTLGEVPGGFIGRRYDEVIRDMWGAGRAEEILKIFRRALETGEPYHDPEFAEWRADRGVTEYYDWRADRIVLPDGRYGAVCYFRDVSEQVNARRAMAESEERYRTLFESIDQGFCILQLIFDDDDKPIDYRYVETNPAFAKQTGMRDAVGRTIRELVPDIEPFWFDVYGKVALTGEPMRFVDHAKSMGRWFEVDAFRIGEPHQRRVAVLFADITSRKQNEQALRESERRFRFMADSAPVFIWLADAGGEATYFNRQWLRYTGRRAEQELGDGWMLNVHPDDLEGFKSTWRDAFAAREGFRAEYRLRRHDGEYRWFVDEGVPRFLPNGSFAGFIGSCIDITDRRLSEEMLREADRLKDEFLATLAHELRNPLAAISTATTVLGVAADDPSRVRQMAATIERQSSQLVRLIDDLLDVTRISRGKIKLDRKAVDIAGIVGRVVEDAHPACEAKQLELQVHLPESPLMVDADAVRMSQVVNNLLENALKFTPPGGTIAASVARESGNAVIRIADTGIGIPEEHRSRIFEMFTQVEDWPNQRSGGLGIGLSLTKSIVDLHGGEVEAKSGGAGKGSEFIVRLALCDRPQVEVEGKKRSERATRATCRRIVVADDNRDMLDTVALMLRIQGHEVATAADGNEALEAIRTMRPDIALLDIGMPAMDGYEVARNIRREPWGSEMLLVAMTGWGQKRDKQQARDAGFDRHLTKPVDQVVLDGLFAGWSQGTGGHQHGCAGRPP